MALYSHYEFIIIDFLVDHEIVQNNEKQWGKAINLVIFIIIFSNSCFTLRVLHLIFLTQTK